jgi:lysophospholipase L1-like esterase
LTERLTSPRTQTRKRRSDFVFAAALAASAAAISPWSIELLTGRPALSARILAISLILDLFLLIVMTAALVRGRARKIALHLAAWTFPFVLFAGLEAVAVAVHLADLIAPTEDVSTLQNWPRWPAHFLSEERWADSTADVRLYRPWRGDGITINRLGLRTALPAPKAPGEWRIAVTGGSAAWGWRVLDADTMPQQLQDVLRRTDPKVTVYNFGIEGALIHSELTLLKQFRVAYDIDQVIFYTGGNDSVSAYMSQANGARRLGWLTDEATGFELFKAAQRTLAMLGEPPPRLLAHLDQDVLPSLLRNNSLREGIRAASTYCDTEHLRCDFFLQPLILTRHPPREPEAAMARTFSHLYPRLAALNERLYAAALISAAAGRIHDFSNALDGASPPFFIDLIHLNEAGNRFVAERIAALVAARQPPDPSR